jgi:hypothetical protein
MLLGALGLGELLQNVGSAPILCIVPLRGIKESLEVML